MATLNTTVVDYGAPDSFFVFLVGHCEEWPENREEQGDIALYKEYLAAGVPKEQICYLKDDAECSQSNCQQQLQNFLTGTRAGTTLHFYYGGHGKPSGFKTIGGIWTYSQVCQTIDASFQGERVLYLLDCCASGNLCHSIPKFNTHSKNKQYICLANTPPFVRASDEGEEWVINHCWLQCMRVNSNGKNVPLQLVMEFIADRLALVLGNQFFGYVRWTLATSLKYCMAGKAPVGELTPHMETFLEMMHNKDLDVKKAALLMVNAAVHHQVRNASVVLLEVLRLLKEVLGVLAEVLGVY